LLFSVLFLFCSLGLGLFISSVASTQTTAVMVTVFATMLPSVLLSGFVFPISSMPLLIRLVTYLVPAKYFLTALRSLFLKSGVGLSVLYPEALFLALFGSLFLFLSAKKFRKVLKA
jgi:ABC-2 type transport system permease protein